MCKNYEEIEKQEMKNNSMKLMHVWFYDSEHDEYILGSELFESFYELYKNGETEAYCFNDYVLNCCDGNGTLERVYD